MQTAPTCTDRGIPTYTQAVSKLPLWAAGCSIG